jgi:glutathione S-transferase
MSSQDVPSDIILFHYTFSPFAKRIVWYLKLRNIPYAECIQPLTLPRPDLAELGINYRRIPLMSIGRDVYYDTRLILARLEQSFPVSSSHPALSTPKNKGLEALLEKFTVDAGIFSKAAQSLPPDLPTMKDEKFIKDRAEFTGSSWSQEARVKGYPEALAHIRHAFDILEAILSDGRQWIGGTDKISLADIHGELDVPHRDNRTTDIPFQLLGLSSGSAICFPRSHFLKIRTQRHGHG